MIKRLNPKAVIKVVSTSDEAVDTENSDLAAYGKTLNLKHIAFKPDLVPTFFLVQNIPAPKRAEISDDHYEFQPGHKDSVTGADVAPTMDMKHQSVMLVKYFEYGIKSIEEDGVVKPVTVEEFPQPIIQEIGAYVMLRSTLGDDEKK